MKNTQSLNRNFEAIAWGALFVWWGVTELVKTLPEGTGALGIGLILLGVNLARMLYGVPVSGFSTVVGILMLIWGGLDLMEVALSLPFELPVFAILLIVFGLIVLAREIRNKNQ